MKPEDTPEPDPEVQCLGDRKVEEEGLHKPSPGLAAQTVPDSERGRSWEIAP